MNDSAECEFVTLDWIDRTHGVPPGTAAATFDEIIDRLVEDEDFIFPAGVGGPLVSESGYYRIIWMFDDDLAWQIHRRMVNRVTGARQVEQAAIPRLVDDPETLRAVLLAYEKEAA
jgi:hypothetical protein